MARQLGVIYLPFGGGGSCFLLEIHLTEWSSFEIMVVKIYCNILIPMKHK